MLDIVKVALEGEGIRTVCVYFHVCVCVRVCMCMYVSVYVCVFHIVIMTHA